MSGKGTKNILIAGAGNIGSRHLQSMHILSPAEYEIFIYTPLEDFALCRERANEVAMENVQYVSSLQDVPSEIHFLVIATTADVRFSVLNEILQNKAVRYSLLEKVLFQNPDEYTSALALQQKQGIDIWVNTPLRTFKQIKPLLTQLDNPSYINLRVSGNNWGIGCNFAHYIDLLAVACHDFSVEIDEEKLKTHKSKREGFVDFTGHIKGRIGDKGHFTLESFDSTQAGFLVTLENPHIAITYAPLTGHASIYNFSTNEMTTLPNAMEYQSNLTGQWIRDIENTPPDLPSLEDSTNIHLPFIKKFIKAHNVQKNGKQICPIT